MSDVNRTKRTKSDAQRQRILHAAWDCFRRRGLHKAGMQEICAEAGLSPGAVYRYFASKEAIIEGIAALERDRCAALLDELATAVDLPAALVRMARAWVPPSAVERADVALYLEVVAETTRSGPVQEIVQMSDREVTAGISQAIRRGQAANRVDPALDSAATAGLIIAAFDGLWVRLLVDTDAGREALLATLETLLRRFLKPPDASSTA